MEFLAANFSTPVIVIMALIVIASVIGVVIWLFNNITVMKNLAILGFVIVCISNFANSQLAETASDEFGKAGTSISELKGVVDSNTGENNEWIKQASSASDVFSSPTSSYLK